MPKRWKKQQYSSIHATQVGQDEFPDCPKPFHGSPNRPDNRDLAKSSSMKPYKKKVKRQILLPKRKGERTIPNSE